MKLSEAERKFLELVRSSRVARTPPTDTARRALSESWVKIGWGGVLELTPAGLRALTEEGETP